jgi:ATP-dependent Lon protease
VSNIFSVEEPLVLVDLISFYLFFSVSDKQFILESLDFKVRSEYVISLLEKELLLFNLESDLRLVVKDQVEKFQKEYFISEQIKLLQREIGVDEDSDVSSLLSLVSSPPVSSYLPDYAKDRVLSELSKLKASSNMSLEHSIIRNYVDCLLLLPWKKCSKNIICIKSSESHLNSFHYGLFDVKDRILEYLSIEKNTNSISGSVLCFLGPPGVGKTSLGRSISLSLKRKFIKISLGGVRDETEIRGHRKTYVGAMPGKIIQNLSYISENNPVILLDEVDKMSSDFRGDPGSALLEVLDPEQNFIFGDHYLEIPYDLSNIFFITTANSLSFSNVLLDRMEVVNISGYNAHDKLNIALKYLIPKCFFICGISSDVLVISKCAILSIVDNYTKEYGVRGLERCILKICRKVVKNNVLN